MSSNLPPERVRRKSPGASSTGRRIRGLVTFCAWCGRVRIAGHWFGKPRHPDVVAHVQRRATSTICPSCFADAAPAHEYPARRSD